MYTNICAESFVFVLENLPIDRIITITKFCLGDGFLYFYDDARCCHFFSKRGEIYRKLK